LPAQTILRGAGDVVRRPRLFEMLDHAAPGRVIVVSGPAGSGKSILVASWLRERTVRGPVAWVSAAEAGDERRFWAALVAELSAVIGATAGGLPSPRRGPRELPAGLTAVLGRLGAPTLLILDGLHRLAASALDGITAMLSSGLPLLQVVLITRGVSRVHLPEDPTRILGGDLSFTTQETGALLTVAGTALPDAAFVHLRAKTEGWAVGLRMALALTRRVGAGRFVAAFSGRDETVAEYLREEVLAGHTSAARNVLLRTCPLEQVEGALANRLSGRHDADRILRELENADALVTSIDTSRSSFRYHPLLADMLRCQLERERPRQAEMVHRTAAGWYAQHGDPARAIRHAEAGRDPRRAGELLKDHWLSLLLSGDEGTIDALLDALPYHLKRVDAELAALMAAQCVGAGRLDDADAWLVRARWLAASMTEPQRRRFEITVAVIDFARTTATTPRGRAAEPQAERPPDTLAEPLTPRERDVLSLLPTHLTAAQIADELNVSTHTVKAHMRSIYSKLSAHRRSEAVDRARALRLLARRPATTNRAM
jgi:LuxR family transcriptional regulator, maltose regulon positive regulatory protein